MYRLLLILICLVGCQSNENKLNLNFQVKGLKKGVVLLNKFKDSSFITIDSFQVNGHKIINFIYDLKEPEILFLDLKTNDNQTKTLNFFAENSEINVVTTIENYGFDMSVKGSVNDSILREYLKNIKKFNNNKLDLIQETLINSQNNDKDALALSNQKIDNLTKRQFLYTANFAINNASYEVSPYIAISELIDSKYLLDTVYKSLDKRILSSKYAIKLKDIAN